VVLVLFENRSFDNLLGHLYQPGEVPPSRGCSGRICPIPSPAGPNTVPSTCRPLRGGHRDGFANPDAGEEYQHTNTQLFNQLDEANRFKDATEMVAPFNVPVDGRTPTMDGFVTDYINFFTVEMGRQPTYDEYKQIMTGYSPDQVPVLSELAEASGSSTTGSARCHRRP